MIIVSEKWNHICKIFKKLQTTVKCSEPKISSMSQFEPAPLSRLIRLKHMTESVFLYTSFVVDDINTLYRSEDYGEGWKWDNADSV